jgi:hypothetical protein
MGIAYNSSIATDGLVFHLDAANVRSYVGSGNTSYSLNNNITLGLNNGVGFTSTGRGMFVLDGTNDTLTSTNLNIPYASNTLYTLEAVCRFNTNPNAYQTVFLYGNSNQNEGLIISKSRSGYANGYVYGGVVSGGVGIFSGTTFTGDQIVSLGLAHYVVTVTKPGSNYVVNMYVNGQLNSTTTSAYTTYTFNTPNFLGLSSGGSFNEPVNGNIAMVRVYNRALSALEVKQNYNALRDRYGI